jgi:hypothetical protein
MGARGGSTLPSDRHDREERRAQWKGKIKREIYESSRGTGIIEGYGERIMNTYNLEFEARRC